VATFWKSACAETIDESTTMAATAKIFFTIFLLTFQRKEKG
jgi:hypothetical protein